MSAPDGTEQTYRRTRRRQGRRQGRMLAMGRTGNEGGALCSKPPHITHQATKGHTAAFTPRFRAADPGTIGERAERRPCGFSAAMGRAGEPAHPAGELLGRRRWPRASFPNRAPPAHAPRARRCRRRPAAALGCLLAGGGRAPEGAGSSRARPRGLLARHGGCLGAPHCPAPLSATRGSGRARHTRWLHTPSPSGPQPVIIGAQGLCSQPPCACVIRRGYVHKGAQPATPVCPHTVPVPPRVPARLMRDRLSRGHTRPQSLTALGGSFFFSVSLFDRAQTKLSRKQSVRARDKQTIGPALSRLS